ncbi:hypothetical protein INT45_002658 [Circinella minor]|uniref:Uncharacterized protein n=1 Tax=Circinella minor TaxID=1195481 RepID=A0A8H7RL59_9FUNG|nr:hypothetical protein INT45_002658 [Circinella minor]
MNKELESLFEKVNKNYERSINDAKANWSPATLRNYLYRLSHWESYIGICDKDTDPWSAINFTVEPPYKCGSMRNNVVSNETRYKTVSKAAEVRITNQQIITKCSLCKSAAIPRDEKFICSFAIKSERKRLERRCSDLETLSAFNEATFDCGLTLKGTTYSFQYGFSITLLKSNQRLDVAKQFMGHTSKSNVVLQNYSSDLSNFDIVTFVLEYQSITIKFTVNSNLILVKHFTVKLVIVQVFLD